MARGKGEMVPAKGIKMGLKARVPDKRHWLLLSVVAQDFIYTFETMRIYLKFCHVWSGLEFWRI